MYRDVLSYLFEVCFSRSSFVASLRSRISLKAQKFRTSRRLAEVLAPAHALPRKFTSERKGKRVKASLRLDITCITACDNNPRRHPTVRTKHAEDNLPKMKSTIQYLLATILLLVLPAAAQFQMFEQMFQQQHHQQHQQPQNAASDSQWYQQNYEAGKPLSPSPPPSPYPTFTSKTYFY